MKKSYRLLTALVLVLCVGAFLAGCSEAAGSPADPNQDVVEFTLIASDASELAALDQYPNLQKVDLKGSTCYDAILSYMAAHPQVEVEYDVAIGNAHYSPAHTGIELQAGAYTFDELLQNLKYLPQLTELKLPGTTLTVQELTALQEAYPTITLGYSLDLLGTKVDASVTELDLSTLEPGQVAEAAAVLPMLPNLTDIQLMTNGASMLSMTDVKQLMDAAPNATVHYTFDLFGKTVSTTDERVEFVRTYIGNEGIDTIRQALDILPKCTYFKMDRCEVDNEVMAQLREDYPDTKIVWRVFFAFYNCLTDVEMLHCTNKLDDKNVEVLKYCNDVLYLDIGHNTELSNLTFVNYMPKLKIAIVVDCATPDIEPFGNCPDLEWLEIVNCRKVTDLSPLANCTKLKGLNTSAVYGIKDLTPLYGLQNMERLYLGHTSITNEQYQEAKKALPNCWVSNTHYSASNVSYNYAIGWRLDENGERAEWYKEIREIFRYDEDYYNHDD